MPFHPMKMHNFLVTMWAHITKLADYLDYRHMQAVQAQSPQRHSREDVTRALALDEMDR